MSNRNRTAGHNYERKIVKDFKKIGYKEACTTRYSSKEKDDAKVDIDNTNPFNIQCKFTKNYPNLSNLLNEMPNDTNYNVILHKKNKGKGGKTEEIAVLKKKDFLQIIEILKTEKII